MFFHIVVTLFQIYNHIWKGGVYMSKPIKPGTDNQPKGTYQEVGPKGGAVNRPRVVHIDKGDRLPPTQKPGNKWVKK
uniref:YjzC-like protein n=3 Tax=unclassified Caudoviricetes TaxID=2788787 RepID=A0A8S5MES8_9CAUD|nr:MAG TPA: YjzC-like protein [Siphoviridae sp. ctet217]